jgi:hypothetical protein
LRERGLIRIVDRGTTSNAYVISWPVLFNAHDEMKAFERLNARRDKPKVAAQDGSVRPEVAAKPMKENLGTNRTYDTKWSSDDDQRCSRANSRTSAMTLGLPPHTSKAVETLVSIMTNQKAAPAARVSAANALLDRGYGKPPQHITGEGGPVYVARLPAPCKTVDEWMASLSDQSAQTASIDGGWLCAG